MVFVRVCWFPFVCSERRKKKGRCCVWCPSAGFVVKKKVCVFRWWKSAPCGVKVGLLSDVGIAACLSTDVILLRVGVIVHVCASRHEVTQVLATPSKIHFV